MRTSGSSGQFSGAKRETSRATPAVSARPVGSRAAASVNGGKRRGLRSTLPTSRTEQAQVPQTLARVPGQANGHYGQWVEACLAGPGKMEVSSPFELAGPLTEALLVANLAIRGYDIQRPRTAGANPNTGGFDYPGRGLELVWDPKQLKVTNFDDVNRFVKRDYRPGWDVKA